MLYHESHGAGVDVGVMDAAVFSVGVLPVGGTFVLLTEASGFSWICDGPDGEHKQFISDSQSWTRFSTCLYCRVTLKHNTTFKTTKHQEVSSCSELNLLPKQQTVSLRVYYSVYSMKAKASFLCTAQFWGILGFS